MRTVHAFGVVNILDIYITRKTNQKGIQNNAAGNAWNTSDLTDVEYVRGSGQHLSNRLNGFQEHWERQLNPHCPYQQLKTLE